MAENRLARFFMPLAAGLSLAACATTPQPEVPADPLPFFGEGYRYAGDPCRRLGENEVTINWLDDAADLVGCPVGEVARAFAASTGARHLEVIDGTLVMSVPRR